MKKPISDAKMIKALQYGDLAALNCFIRQYTAYISTIITRIIGSRPADCEELTADVFIAVWENRGKLREGKITSYLAAIARNKAFDFLRSNKETLPLEDDIIITDAQNIEMETEAKELQRLLKEALQILEKPQRELFVRHYYYGQTIKEAASEMEINLSTAKTWLYRGQTVLREALEKKGVKDLY